MKRLLLAAAGLLALTACDMRPEHAEWQSQCVSSHVDAYPVAMPVSGPNGTVTIQMQMQYTSVCDRYEPVCVAGKDGSTECPVR